MLPHQLVPIPPRRWQICTRGYRRVSLYPPHLLICQGARWRPRPIWGQRRRRWHNKGNVSLRCHGTGATVVIYPFYFFFSGCHYYPGFDPITVRSTMDTFLKSESFERIISSVPKIISHFDWNFRYERGNIAHHILMASCRILPNHVTSNCFFALSKWTVSYARKPSETMFSDQWRNVFVTTSISLVFSCFQVFTSNIISWKHIF